MTRKFWGCTAIAAILLAAFGTSCTRDKAGAQRDMVVVALASEPDVLNPYLATSYASVLVANRLLPRLAIESMPHGESAGGLTPELAESWERSEDGKTLTIKLREGWTWADGAPVSCEDILFTLDAQTSPDLAWRGASIKRSIEGMRCEDPRTVVVTFDKAYPQQMLDVNDIHILPASLARHPFNSWRLVDWTTELVTGGTHRLVSQRPGEEIVLARHDGYAGPSGVAKSERLVLRFVPDSTSRVTQLLAGDVHVAHRVSPDEVARIEAADGAHVVRRPGFSFDYVGWNFIEPAAYASWREQREAACRASGDEQCLDDGPAIARLAAEHPHPILGDARVRRALTLAIHREAIVDVALIGEGMVPASPFLAPMPLHDAALEPWPYDQGEAKRLLTEAGFVERDGRFERNGEPLVLRIAVMASHAQRVQALTLIQSQLATIGVGVDIVTLDKSGFFPAVRSHSIDGWIAGWRMSLRNDMVEMLGIESCATDAMNFGCWAHGRADELARALRDESDADEQIALARAWERIFHEEQPYAILYRPIALTGVRDELTGPDTTVSPIDPLEGSTTWHLGAEH